jgi:hypothetical protein
MRMATVWKLKKDVSHHYTKTVHLLTHHILISFDSTADTEYFN